MAFLEQHLQERIERKLKEIQKLRPLPQSALKKLQEQFRIEMAYNSNAIEGNSLTLKETFLVINEGITIKGKPLKDHLEAKDHHEALEYLYNLVDKEQKPGLSEHLIRTLHQLVMQKTDEEWAGRYRNSDVIIAGSDHKPPAASLIPAQMRQLVKWFGKDNQKLHLLELAALLHHKITFIHPFFDGNGRVARLVMNVVLMRAGYPLAVILKNDRKKYYRVLARADEGEYLPFVRFIAQSVERSLDIYLKTLTPKTHKKEKFMSLSEISKKAPYSAKYLNFLARQGRLEAHKERRNWLTSLEAVRRYIQNRQRRRKI